MIVAFFHDEPFTRDQSCTYSSTGGVPYAALARYLRHFERVLVVGRLETGQGNTRTVASGPGVEWSCVAAAEGSRARFAANAWRHIRGVLPRIDAAVVRMPSLIGILACREALQRGTPLLVEVVGDAFDSLWNHGSLLGKISAVPNHLLNRHYIGRAEFASYVTRETLQRRYPPRGAWAAASDVVIAPSQADLLARRVARIGGRTQSAPALLGLAGSYDVNYKGHGTALRAVALLAQRGHDVKLRCIGVGDSARWRARAEQLGISSRVELGSPLPQGEPVLEWMDELDLYIIPSLQEGLPRALIEAMSRALPAVGSRKGGIPELLDASYLHRPGDHRGLAKAVETLVQLPERMKEQARRNWSVAAGYTAQTLEARRDGLIRDFKEAAARQRRESCESQRMASR